MRLTEAQLQRAQGLIAGRLGLDFPESRRADLEQGLLRALQDGPNQRPEEYLAWLATVPEEDSEFLRLASQLTVGETYFFRDRAIFAALEQEVLPSLIASRWAEGVHRLRLWSAACATGEEPYSLAILLDRLLPDRADWSVTLLATDINPESLATARHGVYRAWALRETPLGIREHYFCRREAETFELDSRIREMVTFAPTNLAAGGYPNPLTNTTAMDLILCRNVLMYFTRDAQRAAVCGLEQALLPGGWLAVSPAEAAADLFHPLLPVNFPGAVFFRKEEGAAVSHQPSAISLRTETGTIAPQIELQDAAQIPSQLPTPNLQPPTPSAQPFLDRARALANSGHLEQARRLCEAAVAENRLDPEACLLLAAICQEQGAVEAAAKALRHAIYLEADSASAHFLLGSLLFSCGRQRHGRRCMETVIRLLGSVPGDEVVPGADGLTAARLLNAAKEHLSAWDAAVVDREAEASLRSHPRAYGD